MYITKGKRRLWHHSSPPSRPRAIPREGDEGQGKKVRFIGIFSLLGFILIPSIASQRSLSVRFSIFFSVFFLLFLTLFYFVCSVSFCFWLRCMSLTWPLLSSRKGGATAAHTQNSIMILDRKEQGPQFHLYQIDFRTANNNISHKQYYVLLLKFFHDNRLQYSSFFLFFSLRFKYLNGCLSARPPP
jgi:hypothetical protein